MTFFSSCVIGRGVARDAVADAMLIKIPLGFPGSEVPVDQAGRRPSFWVGVGTAMFLRDDEWNV